MRPTGISGVSAFRPNRESLGGTAYLVEHPDGNILIDCPAPEYLSELSQPVRWLIVTHRLAIGTPAASRGSLAQAQAQLDCEIIIHEQEAYLAPQVTITTWQDDQQLLPDVGLIWTPGHSPGSCCVHLDRDGGVLFSGRHIIPDRDGTPTPQRQTKTFHWRRQLQSCQKLLDTLPAPAWLCPGANTGYLRGKVAIAVGGQKNGAEPWFQLETTPLAELSAGSIAAANPTIL